VLSIKKNLLHLKQLVGVAELPLVEKNTLIIICCGCSVSVCRGKGGEGEGGGEKGEGRARRERGERRERRVEKDSEKVTMRGLQHDQNHQHQQ